LRKLFCRSVADPDFGTLGQSIVIVGNPMHVSELLVTVDHDEAGGQFLDGPWRREAQWLFEAMRIRPV
jgi:hypothetical protein